MHFDIWKLADFNIIASLFFLVAAWRWGDWRNWQKYYPTILFIMFVNYANGYITYNQPLWQFESPLLKTTLSDIFVSLLAYPSTVLLFLPRYPNGTQLSHMKNCSEPLILLGYFDKNKQKHPYFW